MSIDTDTSNTAALAVHATDTKIDGVGILGEDHAFYSDPLPECWSVAANTSIGK
ncbi:MAG: hypothetical protein ACLTDX_02380 [[Clostridium] innocuum]